ncbi:DgyrCDS1772 [Dimorphilus gyrociliatus]|uniref:COX assembly mitochondrial protein n=1 Tax=Dimorphilus gyrociliatus TaxID=2664684 RepID=A0A7I8V8K1_9ANNE|nr:DgyrCDS1772 [Dimorphilus gyrociliatus]
MSSENEQQQYSVLPKSMSGGPHGLGDPTSKDLRVVEKEVVIGKIMKKVAHERCREVVKAFNECGKNNGLLMPFKCRKENDQMKKCLTRWYQDDEFRAECTQMYLDERSEYRRTGISKIPPKRGAKPPQS